MKKTLSWLLVLMMSLSLCLPALAAQEDVEGELVIYTSMYAGVVEMMDAALKKEFPNLKPGNDGSFFFRAGSGELITKIYGEMGTGKDQPLGCDLLMVAEPSFSLELNDAHYLQSFELEDAENVMRFPYGKDGTWYPVRVCNMVLAYNPEMEESWKAKGVTIPKTFKDFAADPALKGYISMGNPLTSGTSYAAVVSLIGKYGEGYLDQLAANKVMRESGPVAIAKLQSGECAAIMILEESILKFIDDEAKKGNTVTNLKVIYPEDGVILIPSNIMVVAEELSKNVNTDAAEAVARWFLSEDGQKMILEGFMHSTLKGVPAPRLSVDTDSLIRKDLGVDWEKAYHEREAITNLWNVKVTQ